VGPGSPTHHHHTMAFAYLLVGYIYVAACTRVAVLFCLPDSASYDQRRAVNLFSTLVGIFWPFYVVPKLIQRIIQD
jgi:hypothetical protein